MAVVQQTNPNIACEVFGHLPDGRLVERVKLRGATGFEVVVITLGSAVLSIQVPDRDRHCADIVLAHADLPAYLARRSLFGATLGRCANRIAAATFGLDGRRIQVTANNGDNSLHGGAAGFDLRLWSIAALA